MWAEFSHEPLLVALILSCNGLRSYSQVEPVPWISWHLCTAFFESKLYCSLLLSELRFSYSSNGQHEQSIDYAYSDILQCFQRSTDVTGRQNHVIFWGDSRIREQYHSFARLITGSRKYWKRLKSLTQQTDHEYNDTSISLHLVRYIYFAVCNGHNFFKAQAMLPPSLFYDTRVQRNTLSTLGEVNFR